jgi:hypothetical protein
MSTNIPDDLRDLAKSYVQASSHTDNRIVFITDAPEQSPNLSALIFVNASPISVAFSLLTFMERYPTAARLAIATFLNKGDLQ